MRAVRYEPEAIDELAEAIAWYEREGAGLGVSLLNEVDAVVASLATGEHVPILPVPGIGDSTVRRILLERFPYSIVFVEHEGVVRIVAVAHHKRGSRYWEGRIP